MVPDMVHHKGEPSALMALLKFFKYDLLITLAALIGAAFYGGIVGMVSAAILIVLEIVFSFDNAGVNAKYLNKMSHAWRNIFLTVGVLVAVFGMRLIFPFLIVCLAGHVSPIEAWNLAMERGDPHTPGTYGFILESAHHTIASFGGMFLLMLFLSFAKRRDDVVRMNETGHAPRQNTIRYNLTFINQAITITASVTLVCYIMYTVSPETIQNFDTDHLYLTSVFVLLGLLRYIQISVVDKKSGDPTKVMLHDRFMQLIVLAFGLAFLFIIYVLKNIQ